MENLKATLLAFGLPGLFLIAVLDSAGVPLPGGVDVILMLLSWQRPSLFILVALVAAVGSTIGCIILYRIAKVGGDAALKRVDPKKREWVEHKLEQNDILAMMVAVMGPPPFPTKVFILAAGALGMKWHRFVTGVFVGRMIRFTGEAYLAVRLGDRAAEVLRQHYPTIGIALVTFVVAVVLGRMVLKKRASAAA